MTDNANEQNIKQNKCLIEELSVLKESSLEAVDSPELQSKFNSYMHIDREVQKEFWKIVSGVADSNKAQLILLCGSVGDGKSHILSYYSEHEPETMKKFKIHNDSTASFYKNKPAIETLKETLACFSDDQIETSSEKWIIAINLGTLTNFLGGDTENKFTKLRKYVEEQKILETTISEREDGINGNFHYVNFSDYHLYTLEDEKVKSQYIKSILKKITDENEENIFYKSYQRNCKSCCSQKKCPVKANYELLSNDTLQEMLIQCLVEAIIKGKVILSTRGIFDFIYDLLVDRRYVNDSSSMIATHIEQLNEERYVKALLPNTLFSHEEGKGILMALNACDPLNVKNDVVDDLVIHVLNNSNILSLVKKNIPELSDKLAYLSSKDFSDPVDFDLKKECLKLYIRASKLFNTNRELMLQDELYDKFVRELYHWNKSNQVKLRELYDNVRKAILLWNGDAPKGTMRLNVGKHQMKYVLSQEVKIDPYIEMNRINPENEVKKFMEEITLEYKDKNGNKIDHQIAIDFNLFKLVYCMKDGYKPNRKDKNLYVKFDDFVNQVQLMGSQDEKIIIEEKNKQDALKYEFSYDDFGYTFEVKR